MDALELLYGFRPDVKRIVGAHEHKDDSLLVYQRLEDDRIRKRVAKFKPYGMFHHGVVDALQEEFVVEEVSELKGPGRIDRMVRFKGFVQFHKIKSWARKELGDDDYFIETDPVTQWLQQTGITFFGGMAMDDILRMQIDLEVWSDGQFPNAERETDYIFIIAISDNRGYEEALYVEGDAEVSIDGPYRRMPNEERMLRELVKIIHRRDPDSLEFHNGVGFDLPYLRDRCEMHGVNFGIGRDNSVPRSFTRSKDFAEAEIEFQSFQIAGRSVIDSMFEAMDYDVYKRDLPGYGLKQVAKHFGVAAEDRTYIEGSKLASTWDTDPDRVLRYALDDVRETKAIMEVLGDKSFELTSMVPWKYQKVQTGGQAKAIEALMARSYIRAGYAFPERQTSGTYQGAYSELFRRGVFENLAYADVSSLYPSNMMVYRITSQNDYLGTFLPLLEGLTELRLKTKKKMREMEDGPERRRLDAKQSSYKTLINSFYGALGTRFFQWCDIQGASKVCLKGQYILKRMIHEIRDRGGTVVLCDSVTADTPIYTKDREGRLNITSIASLHGSTVKRRGSNGLKVLTGSGWKKYNYTYRHETNKEIIQTSTYDSTIQTTRDHSLMSDGKEVSPDQLKGGTKLDHNRPNLPETDVGTRSDYRQGFFWGAMCGDGSASRVKRKEDDKTNWSTNVSFHNQNKDLNETIQTIAKEQFGISMNLYDTSESSNTMRLTGGNNKEDYEFVARKVYDQATGEKKVPMCVLNGTEEKRKGFLDGYFATDGYDDGYGRQFTTKSHILAAGVWMLLQEYHPDVNVGDRADKEKVLRLIEVQNSRTKKETVRRQRNRGKCNGAVYDISTQDGTFVAGVGGIVAHNTDGVLFKYPEGMSKDDVNALIQEISESMPDGIEIDNDGFFDKAIAYKPKNYALLPAGEDEFKVKGVSLKGRSKEPFLLEFLQRQLQYIFDGDVQAAHDDYMNLTRQIAAKNLSVDALSKRARVKMNLDTYIEKKVEGDENQLPQYEVALRADKIHDYDVLKGDMFRYYIGGGNAKHYKSYKRARLVEEYDNDENVYHYLDRLKKTVEILQEMVEKPGAVYPDPHHIAAQHGLFDDSEQDLGGLVTKVVKEVPDNPSDRKVFP